MKYVYFYHGTAQETVGSITNAFGVVERDSQIASAGDYADVKRCIAAEHLLKPEQFVLCSLSLLNPERP